MVAAPGTQDAVTRARALPSLAVGLHVVLVNGRPALPSSQVPDLVDRNGDFPTDLVAAGVRYFFHPGARRQLEAEIRAQFEAFAQTGLPLDHVNAQNHMHVHPTILATILRIGPEYGMRAVRIPREPFMPSWRSAHRDLGLRLGNAALLSPWLALMQAQIERAGMLHNDAVLGLSDTGKMTPERVQRLLEQLPASGVTEMYFHPDTGSDELQALCDPSVIRTVRSGAIVTMNFAQLGNAA